MYCFAGAFLLKKMLVAIPACQMHRRALEGFEEHIREASPATLETWRQMYEDWQASSDKSKNCPFVAPQKGMCVL